VPDSINGGVEEMDAPFESIVLRPEWIDFASECTESGPECIESKPECIESEPELIVSSQSR